MTATLLKFPNAARYRPSVYQERTDAAIIELGETMDEMRSMLDRPHATEEYEKPLGGRGLFNVLWILACWNLLNTLCIAIWLAR